jgi:hypothetical protein
MGAEKENLITGVVLMLVFVIPTTELFILTDTEFNAGGGGGGGGGGDGEDFLPQAIITTLLKKHIARSRITLDLFFIFQEDQAVVISCHHQNIIVFNGMQPF